VTIRGTQQSQAVRSSPTVLIIADRRQSHTGRALKAAGYRVMTSFTPDHAVALCVNNPVDAVVLDQQHFVVTDDWSVAQSLKMIKARMCVLLVVRGKIVGKDLPPGVDAVIREGDTERLLKTLEELL
jgi:PleD family two-component response regulator